MTGRKDNPNHGENTTMLLKKEKNGRRKGTIQGGEKYNPRRTGAENELKECVDPITSRIGVSCISQNVKYAVKFLLLLPYKLCWGGKREISKLTVMFRIALLLFLLTFTTGARCLFAQADDNFSPFTTEYTQIILAAAKSGTKSITLYEDKVYSRRRTKEKITFLNDSVFVRKSGLHKSKYVIRHGKLFLYDPKAEQPPDTSVPPVDSAGYKVYWTQAEKGMPASYTRIMYDSLGRELDYYYNWWGTRVHTVTCYEGDTAVITERWSQQGDSMYLYLTSYCYQSYNADSTFFIRAVRYFPKWANNVYSMGPQDSDTRKYITYDDQHRIVAVRTEEVVFYTDDDPSVGVSNLRVTYH